MPRYSVQTLMLNNTSNKQQRQTRADLSSILNMQISVRVNWVAVCHIYDSIKKHVTVLYDCANHEQKKSRWPAEDVRSRFFRHVFLKTTGNRLSLFLQFFYLSYMGECIPSLVSYSSFNISWLMDHWVLSLVLTNSSMANCTAGHSKTST